MAATEKDMDIKASRPTGSPDPEADIMSSKEAGGIRDVNADLFLEIGNYSHEELEAERIIVRKKLDLIIMPMYGPQGSRDLYLKLTSMSEFVLHTACNSWTSCP